MARASNHAVVVTLGLALSAAWWLTRTRRYDAAPRQGGGITELTLRPTAERITINELILGTAPLGGLYRPVNKDTAVATIRKAVDAGITYFDTAPLYGFGFSEELLGEALPAQEAERAGGIKVSTKVGRVLKERAELSADDRSVEWDQDNYYKTKRTVIPVLNYSAEGVRQSFEDSKRRLRVRGGTLECLRIHDAENEERYAAAVAPGGAVEALVELRKVGEIKDVSAGMNNATFLLRLARAYPPGTFDSFMVAGCWNLLDWTGYELFQECAARNIKVVNCGVFGSGLLWGGTHLRYVEAQAEAISRTALWAGLAKRYDLPLPAVALAWAYLPTVVDRIAIGCVTPEQLDANLALLNHKVPAKLWQDAKAEGLLPEWMPVPEVQGKQL